MNIYSISTYEYLLILKQITFKNIKIRIVLNQNERSGQLK